MKKKDLDTVRTAILTKTIKFLNHSAALINSSMSFNNNIKLKIRNKEMVLVSAERLSKFTKSFKRIEKVLLLEHFVHQKVRESEER